MSDVEESGFKEGDRVWVEDADRNRHPGIFVGYNEAAGWFGGGPSAYVAHPEAHQAEVVSVFRITPREEERRSPRVRRQGRRGNSRQTNRSRQMRFMMFMYPEIAETDWNPSAEDVEEMGRYNE